MQFLITLIRFIRGSGAPTPGQDGEPRFDMTNETLYVGNSGASGGQSKFRDQGYVDDQDAATLAAAETYTDSHTGPVALASDIHGATGKTTPVDADEIPISDSAASWGLKKLPWGNLKATAQAAFDLLYQPISALLTAIAGLSANGLVARTGSGTAAARSIVGGTGITITHGDGASGNPTVAADTSVLATQTYADSGDAATLATAEAYADSVAAGTVSSDENLKSLSELRDVVGILAIVPTTPMAGEAPAGLEGHQIVARALSAGTGITIANPDAGDGAPVIAADTSVLATLSYLSSLVVAVANGGTGLTGLGANSMLYGSGGTTMNVLAAVASRVMICNGSSVPTWSNGLPTPVMNNITAVGTVASGTWQGTPVAPAYGGVPTGAVMPYAASSAPSGWLLCDGSAVSRTTYATLFALIGTTFGSGNGSTTFNVPDMRGRSALGTGTGSGLTARTLGDTGGTETHTLDSTEIPSHTHGPGSLATNSGGAHTHTYSAQQATDNIQSAGENLRTYVQDFAAASISGTTSGISSTHSHSVSSGVTDATGGGLSHPNMHPFLALNHIIKT